MKLTLVLLCALLGFSAAATVPGGRIIGGHNAGEGQFPYMVSLRSQNAHFCGGWIHNSRWIVTAGHCVFGRFATNTFSVVGSVSLGGGGVTHNTQRIVAHPNFNANTLANDIGLVYTEDVIVFTATVQPIPLGTANTGSGTLAVISGWGITANPGYSPDLMQWLQKATISNTSCRLAHTVANRSRIGDTNICTDNPSGLGNCIGDNGGPLVSGAAVIGVFSWSVPCAQGTPDIYSRVSSFAPWVNQMTAQND